MYRWGRSVVPKPSLSQVSEKFKARGRLNRHLLVVYDNYVHSRIWLCHAPGLTPPLETFIGCECDAHILYRYHISSRLQGLVEYRWNWTQGQGRLSQGPIPSSGHLCPGGSSPGTFSYLLCTAQMLAAFPSVCWSSLVEGDSFPSVIECFCLPLSTCEPDSSDKKPYMHRAFYLPWPWPLVRLPLWSRFRHAVVCITIHSRHPWVFTEYSWYTDQSFFMSHELQNNSWLCYFLLLIVLIIVDTGSLVLPWQRNEQFSESKRAVWAFTQPCRKAVWCRLALYSRVEDSKLAAKPF